MVKFTVSVLLLDKLNFQCVKFDYHSNRWSLNNLAFIQKPIGDVNASCTCNSQEALILTEALDAYGIQYTTEDIIPVIGIPIRDDLKF